jgi:hypothetical protein
MRRNIFWVSSGISLGIVGLLGQVPLAQAQADVNRSTRPKIAESIRLPTVRYEAVYMQPAPFYTAPKPHSVRAVWVVGQPMFAYTPQNKYVGPVQVQGQSRALYLHPSLVYAKIP